MSRDWTRPMEKYWISPTNLMNLMIMDDSQATSPCLSRLDGALDRKFAYGMERHLAPLFNLSSIYGWTLDRIEMDPKDIL